MITYWSRGRNFVDDHSLAIRFVDEGLADRRMRETTFPKEDKIDTKWCSPCNAWHITRPSRLPLTVVASR